MEPLLASWPAPAKLNLFLHVIGRRADGYHLLQTLFQFLDYGDELRFTVTDDPAVVRVNDIVGVPAEQDLTLRAARLLQTSAAVPAGVRIELIKRLPIGGGLGGGSSDAATVLLALNQLWQIKWPLTRLAELALQLGADVPVFIYGYAAWAEGVGERCTPAAPTESWYAVIAPPVAVATASVFAAAELTRSTPPITIRDFHAGHTRNDLEAVVRKRYPEVDRALEWLAAFGRARMSGSGACVFVAAADRAAAESILAQLPRLGPSYSGFVAKGLNIHPVHARLPSMVG